MAHASTLATASGNDTGEASLHEVRRVVASASRSRSRELAADVATKGVAGGLTLAVIAESLALAGLIEVPRAAFWTYVAIAAGTGALISASTLAILAIVKAPSAVETAREVDGRLSLKDRLSSALEVADRVPAANDGETLLRSALFADAGRMASTILPAALRTRRPRRWLWIVPILLVGVAGLGALHQTRELAGIPAALVPSTLAEEERKATDATLREIVALIRQDDAATRTPVLEALARTAEAVRNDLASGELDRTELKQTLEDLSRQATQASGDFGNATASRISKTLDEQISALERGPRQIPEEPTTTGTTAGSSQARSTDVATPSEPLPTADAAQTTLQPGQTPPEGTQYYSPDPHAISQQMAERAQAQQNQAGTPAGGARDADRGGNQAGEGVRPLVASMDELAALSAASLETMVLPQNDASTGQRVRISTVPPEVLPGRLIDGNTDTAGWQVGEAEPLNRSEASRRNLEILQRYFPRSGGEF